jgi:hypothetical protein
MAVRVSGKIVFVKPEKSENGKHYKRLQLFSQGNGHQAVLESVTDMSNAEWEFGKEVDLEVALQVYQGKRGLGYSFTYWGNQSGVAAGPPPAVTAPTESPGKSAGKFSG